MRICRYRSEIHIAGRRAVIRVVVESRQRSRVDRAKAVLTTLNGLSIDELGSYALKSFISAILLCAIACHAVAE